MEKSFYDFEQYEKEGIVNIIIQSVITKKNQVTIHKEDGDFFCFIQMFDNIIWGCKC